MAARTCLLPLALCASSFLLPSTAAAQPAPTIDTCAVTATGDVNLTWTNLGSYFQILIQADGANVATLPGGATSFTLVGLPPGWHVLCVAALNVAGAILQPLDCCDAFIPGGGGDPITDFSCDFSAAANAVVLTWVNAGPYTAIDILVDTVLVATLPGSATTHLLFGLTPGGHTICIQPHIGATPVVPPACCDIVVPGGAVSPIASLTCTPTAAAPGVFLTWVNLGAYDAIEVTLDGVLVAVLPGGQSSYSIVPLAAGIHTVCVTPVHLGSLVLPAACCTLSIGGAGAGPIDGLTCTVGPAIPPGAVLLTWTNNGVYDSIELYLDGMFVVILLGSDTSHLLTNLAPGTHTASLRAFAGGAAIPPDPICTFTIGGGVVSPIASIQCGPVPGAVGIFVSWTNGGAYTSIDIEFDGLVIATLAGSDTGYLVGGLLPGNHTVCVIPYVGASAILPPACCTFFVPPRFVRGDANADGLYNIGDPVFVLTYLFGSGAAPACDDAADANDDAALDIADPLTILNHLFVAAPPPPAPHPSCGADPTVAGDLLGCASFPPCP